MTDHYYTSQPRSPRVRESFTCSLRGREFVFLTDAGVFSRRNVDRGTRLLVESVGLAPDSVLLDLGCGYGAVGIAVSHLVPEGEIHMVDVNERAVELARENVRLNSVANARVYRGDGEDVLASQQFDAVLMNPPVRMGKRVVYTLMECSARSLRPRSGALWVVIRTRQGARSLREEMTRHFREVDEVEKKSGYRVYRGTT